MTVSAQQWLIYEEGRSKGLNQTAAARLASIGVSTARAHDNRQPEGTKYRQVARRTRNQPDPIRPKKLCDEAKIALDDFNYFQERYLGRIGLPWQEEAAHQVEELLTSPDKEYVVINAPPGAGKSSLFTYAIPLWLTCKDRSIRGLVGSATARLGSQYVALIRRALEATLPLEADPEDLIKGIALDAVATLSEDFGRFKPVDAESWTKNAFIVQQFDGVTTQNKEPTWTAVGRDQEFIGGRYDFVMWDDLVTSNRLRTIETIEKDRNWWDTYAERRLEPAGLLILCGQRMGAEDLYRYCLNMEVEMVDDFDAEEDTVGLRETEDGTLHKYHQIIYKAHYEEQCGGDQSHKRNAMPYPNGCLLSPRRVTWRECSAMMKNRPDTYAQVFQQQDVSPDSVLVDPAWINGGNGFPGCWDKDRDRLQIPQGLQPPTYSIVGVDPSPTRYWAIEWWLYNEPSDQYFLIDLLRTGLDAPDLLDWNANEGKFTGIMEDWQQMSRDLGVPITHWIVEQNGCQRWLMQYSHTHRWIAKNSTQIIPHDTYRNKTNEEYGVQMIAPNFKFGRVRLPGLVSRQIGKGVGRAVSMKLVDEVTRYTNKGASTDDCVMACWFVMFQMQYLTTPQPMNAHGRRLPPTWIRGELASA